MRYFSCPPAGPGGGRRDGLRQDQPRRRGAVRRYGSGEFQKKYLCIVRGCPEEREGVWKDLLLHDKARNKSFVVKRMRGGVKEASLEYRVLAEKDGASLVLVRLHTGRTHQIRVQFASRGMPLLGDGRYGGGGGEMALWSCSLAFPHPNGKTMEFQALPEGGVWETFAAEITKGRADS